MRVKFKLKNLSIKHKEKLENRKYTHGKYRNRIPNKMRPIQVGSLQPL